MTTQGSLFSLSQSTKDSLWDDQSRICRFGEMKTRFNIYSYSEFYKLSSRKADARFIQIF